MVVEITILHRQQGINEALRHLIEAQQQTVFELFTRQAIEQYRIHAHIPQIFLGIGILNAFEPLPLESQQQRSSLLATIGKLEGTTDEHQLVATGRVLPSTGRLAAETIVQQFELMQHLLLRQTLARIELQRAAVDQCRQLPLLSIKLVADQAVEIDAGHQQAGEQHQSQLEGQPAPATPVDGLMPGQLLLPSRFTRCHCLDSSCAWYIGSASPRRGHPASSVWGNAPSSLF